MKPGRLAIPFSRDGAGRFLPGLVALMVFLAALSLAAVMGLERALAGWDANLAFTLTVELPPAQGKSDPSAANAATALRAVPGVRSAEPLDRAAIAKLIEPFLGTALSPDDLALPQLIDVRLDPANPADPTALRAVLAKAAPAASLDDHRLWLDKLLRFARSVELTAFLILALIAGAAVLSVSFATRTGLSIHREVIELLHLMGAHDGYVARQFEREALRLGFLGGVAGLALAFAALLALGHAAEAASLLGENVTLLPALHLKGWNYAALLALPLIAGLIAMLTARLTVLATLLRLP